MCLVAGGVGPAGSSVMRLQDILEALTDVDMVVTFTMNDVWIIEDLTSRSELGVWS